MLDTAPLLRDFNASFGGSPRLFRAPGRVNLIGEHTDYMEGYCLPIAVDRAVLVAAAPREDGDLQIRSRAFPDAGRFSAEEVEGPPTGAWHDLVRGMAAVLRRMHVHIRGANLLIDGDVPIGGGLSSSAAVAVATGQALLALSDQRWGALELSISVQAAENEFVGTRSGLLDPLAVTCGRPGHAVLIECGSGETSLVPLDGDSMSVLVFDTRTKRDLSASAYNDRRAECEAGLQLLETFDSGIGSLRDVDAAILGRFVDLIPPPVFSRLRHVVLENGRVLAAVRCLSRGDLGAFGRLMFESHRSLREDYDVSTDELDWVVAEASEYRAYSVRR